MAHIYFPGHHNQPPTASSTSHHQSLTHAARRALQDEQRARKAAALFVRPCELILVRHGETAWNKEGRLQGQQQPGPPLDDLGFQQAAAVARVLQERHPQVDAVYASDLLRAVQTAELVAARYGLPVSQHAGLRERHMGVLQGLTYVEAPHEQPHAWAAMQSDDSSVRLPGGESLDDLRQRLTAAVLDIARMHPGQRVVVISHGGALHAVHAAARGYQAKGKVFNCSISVLLAESDESPAWQAVKEQQQHQHQQHGGPRAAGSHTSHEQHHAQQQQQQQQHGDGEHAHSLLQDVGALSIQVVATGNSEVSVVWCDPSEPCQHCSSTEEHDGHSGPQQQPQQVQPSSSHAAKADAKAAAQVSRMQRCGGGRVPGGRLALMTWNDIGVLQEQHLQSAKGFGGSSRAG